MLRGQRNISGGPSSFAIPSMDEVGGRLLVLRVVAIVTLTRLLRRYDENGRARLKDAIRRATKRKCAEAHLTDADAASTVRYAQAIIDEASARVDGREPAV